MLQAINRYEPLVAHVTESANIHPEQFFGLCISAAGELATFTTTSKRPPKIPPYQHDRLRECFEPVMIALRESLSKVLVQNAVPIPIQPGRFGISVAVVNDRSLFDDAVFILAARADLPSDELRRRFPAQLKIGALRTDWRPGPVATAGRSGQRRTCRAAADPVPRRICVFRARSV